MIRTVLIAGNGKLSNSIINGLPQQISDCRIDRWENNDQYPHGNIAVIHLGSGRQFNDIFNYCEKTSTPLIQGSTGIDGNFTEVNFTYIDAPNFNILMLKFMLMIKRSGALFRNEQISILESHQESKKSLPGTALEFAKALGCDADKIVSIRNPAEQETICGIPKEHLRLHAFHEIKIGDENTSINIRTLVKGHESYIPGIAAVIRSLGNLENRYYHITDLIDMGLI